MASNQPDDNCLNCRHRHEELTFHNCVTCFQGRTADSPFPGWEPEEA